MKYLESLGLDTSDASMYYGCRGQLEFMILDLNMDVCTPAYTLQDILTHLNPNFRRMVIMYSSEEWIDIAYSKLVFQLTHKE